MPVHRMLVPCEIEVVSLTCDSCQAALYSPLNPWIARGVFQVQRQENPGAPIRFAALPQIPEQQAIELATRNGWKVVVWCGQSRLVCPTCGKHENSAIRSN